MRKPAILLVLAVLLFDPSEIIGALKNSTVLYREAVAIAREGNLEKAVPAFQKVIQVSPCYALGHYGLGRSYLSMDGKLKEAIRHLRLSVEYDRKFAPGYFSLALAYMFARKYDASIHYFSRAYRYDNTMLESLYNIAIIYDIKQNRYKSKLYFDQYQYERGKKETNLLF